MDQRYLQLAVAPGRFYDVPWVQGSPFLSGSTVPDRDCDPVGWHRCDQGPWVCWLPGGPLPAQGWKVHVAALPDDAAEVVALAVRVCRRLSVPMKALRSRGLVLASQLKYAAPGSSGKVVTCYPDPDQVELLCKEFATRLAGRDAPAVLGELQVPGAPVYVRYGAVREQWTVDDEGRPVPALVLGEQTVPDRRGHRDTYPHCDEPDYVTSLRRASAVQDTHTQLDIKDVVLLHRSNAGGVYRAVRCDGRTVVLKEARHHAGLDVRGVDAVTRLRHEASALERAGGSGATAEPLEYLTVGNSDFLVTEWLEGRSLASAMSRRHPLVHPELPATEARCRTYLDWVERVLADARRAVTVLHDRGIVHGDVQPANLIDLGDRVVVIDLESSSVDGVAVSTGVATTGFCVSDTATGPRSDLGSLDRVRSMLVNPLTPLLHHRPDLAEELWRVGQADLGVPGAARGDRPSGPPQAPDVAELLAGITASASVTRADRLYPGDVEQFSHPRGGLGLLYGAAGVLLAMEACGRQAPTEHRDWLVRAACAPGPFPRGFGCGAEGVAWALARLGAEEAAGEVVDRFVLGGEASPPAPVPWWLHGSAGIAVALADLAVLLDRPELAAVARQAAGKAVAAVHDAAPATGYAPGLFHGWSGVGLALLRSADLCAPATDTAGVALRRELESAQWVGQCLMTRVGSAPWLPYLGRGSAACGLLAARLLAQDAQEAQVPGLGRVVDGVLATCTRPVVVFGGLMTGRSGLACVLDDLSDGLHPMLEEHRRRLSWHTVPAADSTSDPARFVIGDQNLRCSADLATGAAGMLVALQRGSGSTLVDLLGLGVSV